MVCFPAAQNGAEIAPSWGPNKPAVGYLVVPKGSKNRAAAMRLIDTMTLPENQAKVANMIAYSPTNLEAYKSIDAKLEPWLCTTPENTKKGFVVSQNFWRDNLKDM